MSVPKVQEVYDDDDLEEDLEEDIERDIDDIDVEDNDDSAEDTKPKLKSKSVPSSFFSMITTRLSGLFTHTLNGWQNVSRFVWVASLGSLIFFFPLALGVVFEASLQNELELATQLAHLKQSQIQQQQIDRM